MHDPMTVAFEVPRPWPERGFRGEWRWPSLITIWHVDPETDGSDDSCGWSRPRLSKDDLGRLKWIAGSEARSPWFLREAAKEPSSPADAEALMRGALLTTARLLHLKLTLVEATTLASSLIHEPADNVRSRLCLLPGYHTNDPEDGEWYRQRNSEEFFVMLGSILAHRRRRWWQHPRWHLHHWKVQVHPIQAFKRWAWSRCCKCGGRFPWGASVVSNSWHSKGPQWFQGETDIYHADCSRPESSVAVSTEAQP
jgi:hypothetical protein